MTDASITEIGIQAMILTTKLAAPILITALAIGLLIGMLQSATQLQEPTIAFVPKFIGLAVVLLTHYMAERMRANPVIGRLLGKLAGVFLIGFGVKLAVSK